MQRAMISQEDFYLLSSHQYNTRYDSTIHHPPSVLLMLLCTATGRWGELQHNTQPRSPVIRACIFSFSPGSLIQCGERTMKDYMKNSNTTWTIGFILQLTLSHTRPTQIGLKYISSLTRINPTTYSIRYCQKNLWTNMHLSTCSNEFRIQLMENLMILNKWVEIWRGQANWSGH